MEDILKRIKLYPLTDKGVIRIYEKNNNNLKDISMSDINNINVSGINCIKRYYNNLIQTINIKKIETYTEKFKLLFETDNYIILEYSKNIIDNNLFPNLKTYDNEIQKDFLEVEIKKNMYLKSEEVKFIEIHN